MLDTPYKVLAHRQPRLAHMEIETQNSLQMGEDLITEILLRLPVKSLVRFKAVCKFWRSLISDPHFATSHFERAAPRLLIHTDHGIRTMDLEESLHPDRISELIDYDFSYPVCNNTFMNPLAPWIVGSCRGFLLMSCYDRDRSLYRFLYLWNPSTHVHKPIPSSPVDTNAYEYDRPYEYGFGYDSSKDDYLVVRVPVADTYSSTNFADVQFFSLRANIWKYTESVDLPSSLASTKGGDLPTFTTVRQPSAGLLFNEAIHWVAQNWVDFRVTLFIIAFDLMEKRLVEIPQPQPVDLFPQGFGLYYLWVHGRFFSLSALRGNTIEIWVMKKYKVQSSWTKTLVLSSEPLFPLCSTKGGDIVIDCGENLTKYSDEGLQGDQLENFNHFGLVDSSVPLYTESMLSLPDVSG